MVTTRFDAPGDPELDALYADLAAADLQPLWRLTGLLPEMPNRLSPHIWRWKALRSLAERSGELVGIDRGGDRRVLSLVHPDLGGLPFATHTLWGAVQYLRGGELAPAHRHTPAALRFVMAGSGVWTLVDGDAIAMEPGDLVLTPSMCWHEHHNPGTEPMVWFDGLDLPLVRNLDAVFYEDGPEELTEYQAVHRSSAERHYGAAGILPVDAPQAGVLPDGTFPATVEPGGPGRHSPLLAYRWAQTDATLTAALRSTGATTAKVRFTDPTSGGDVMPTMRCEMLRVLGGHRTPTARSVGSSIAVVHRGAGSTVVGGRAFEWTAGDILVLPSWATVQHRAAQDADLFLLCDAPLIEAAGLARAETLPSHEATHEAGKT